MPTKIRFLAQLCIDYAKLHPIYAWICLSTIQKYSHHWNQLLNTFPTVHDMTMCTKVQFFAKCGLNYELIMRKLILIMHESAWVPSRYSHHWNQPQNTFPKVYDMTIYMKSPFLAKFGLNYALIMRKLANYAWPGHHPAYFTSPYHNKASVQISAPTGK